MGYTLKQLGEKLGVSAAAVSTWVTRCNIPRPRSGTGANYTESDLNTLRGFMIEKGTKGAKFNPSGVGMTCKQIAEALDVSYYYVKRVSDLLGFPKPTYLNPYPLTQEHLDLVRNYLHEHAALLEEPTHGQQIRT